MRNNRARSAFNPSMDRTATHTEPISLSRGPVPA
jgi:hypothetical protein